jgi:class 3 adenylate cyclase
MISFIRTDLFLSTTSGEIKFLPQIRLTEPRYRPSGRMVHFLISRNKEPTQTKFQKMDSRNDEYNSSECVSDDGASDTVYSVDIKGENAKDEPALAKNENRAVNIIRVLMVFVLVGVAVAVSYSAYHITSDSEDELFETTFKDQAAKVKETFEANADRRMAALASFSQTITSYAVSSGSVFPQVTLPDFERQAAFALKLSDAAALLTFPIVQAEDRMGWQQYSNASQGWLTESWEAQSEVMGTLTGEQGDIDELRDNSNYNEGLMMDEEAADDLAAQKLITPMIFKVDPATGSVALEDGPGPYAPIWQHAPVLPIAQLVNFNSWSHPTRARELTALVQTQQPLLSSAADFRDDDPLTASRKSVMNLFLNRWMNGTYEYEEGPVSDVYFPIFDHNGPDKQIKSVLTAYVYWQSFFSDILPEDAMGIIVSLRNSCNQSFSYEVNGKTASYLGKGDLHDPKYNHMMVETGWGAVFGSENVPDDISPTSSTTQCFYKVQIYPSEATEEQFTTATPGIFAIVLAAVFCFTSAVFLLYDWCVARRHRVVETSAAKSGAVVRSLFPQKVVERLYDSADKKDEKQVNPSSSMTKNMSTSSGEFLTNHANLQLEEDLSYGNIETSDPIADLYPHCTVFFADIAGFTKWSSNRVPTEVFRFLETLYSAFDKVANSQNVFKVETIGDCYVAVTGLPHAQPNHAVRMAKFASECMTNMNQVVHKMIPILGPDTAALSMRCGLHSGCVTAGILRGQKARFQLFGDTVNTAARMESTGKSGKIQVSEATALLLMKRGKRNWLRLREDMVSPKGKGAMTTYWVEATGVDGNATESVASSNNSDSVGGPPSGRERDVQRSPKSASSKGDQV